MNDTERQRLDALIADLAAIITGAVIQFMIARQINPADLAEDNDKRLGDLGEYISRRLAQLPADTNTKQTEMPSNPAW